MQFIQYYVTLTVEVSCEIQTIFDSNYYSYKISLALFPDFR